MARKNNERNNFQDKAMEREFRKGERAGKANTKKPTNSKRFKSKGTSGTGEKVGGPIDAGDSYINDPMWHAPSPELLEGSSNLADVYVTGTEIQNRYTALTATQQNRGGVVVPGIMVLDYIPTIGKCQAAQDPFNQAMFSEYNFYRQATSGTSYYQAADLGVFQVAIMSAYSLYAETVRAYGLLGEFQPLNNYTPQVLLEALGYNYSDLVQNKANLWTRINLFADALQRVKLPSDIKFMDRQLTLLNHIYVDADNTKAQYYAFRSHYYWKFIEAEEGTSGETIPSSATVIAYGNNDGTPITYQMISDMMDTLIAPLINSTIGNKISAETLKAFGEGKCYTVKQISSDYRVTPIYSQEILSQIENCIVVPEWKSFDFTITQDLSNLATGTFLKANYAFTLNKQITPNMDDFFNFTANANPVIWSQTSHRVVNMHKANPTAGDYMEATRLMAADVSSPTITSTGINITLGSVPTEVIVDISVYTLDAKLPASLPHITDVRSDIFAFESTNTRLDAMVGDDILRAVRVAAFDWAPQMRLHKIGVSVSGANPSYSLNATNFIQSRGIFVDFDNFTTVDLPTLDNMHRISCLGLFKIRSMPN